MWLVAEQVDQWGTSCYERDLGAVALTFHATQAAHRGSRLADKGWWLSEQTGGRTWSHTGDNLRSTEFLRTFHILAMAFGAIGSVYWQWRPEIFGQESPHFGLTNLGGEPTARTAMLKNFCTMLSRHRSIFDNLRSAPSQVGLLYEPRTIMYEQMGRGVRGESWWWRNFVGWHRALLDRGYPMDILHARDVSENGVPEGIRLLIAPMQVFERKGLTARLAEWTSQGNVLIGGPWFAMYDEGTYVNQECPPSDLFGVKQSDIFYPETFAPLNPSSPRIELLGDLQSLGGLPAAKLIEDLEAPDASPVGLCGDSVVMTERSLGSGRALYIGSFVGSVYDRIAAPQIGGLIDVVASGRIQGSPLRILPPIRATGGSFVRSAWSDKTLIVFVINPSEEDITTWLQFPPDLRCTVTDLWTDEVIGTTEGGLPIRLTLAGEGARVLAVK